MHDDDAQRPTDDDHVQHEINGDEDDGDADRFLEPFEEDGAERAQQDSVSTIG